MNKQDMEKAIIREIRTGHHIKKSKAGNWYIKNVHYAISKATGYDYYNQYDKIDKIVQGMVKEGILEQEKKRGGKTVDIKLLGFQLAGFFLTKKFWNMYNTVKKEG